MIAATSAADMVLIEVVAGIAVVAIALLLRLLWKGVLHEVRDQLRASNGNANGKTVADNVIETREDLAVLTNRFDEHLRIWHDGDEWEHRRARAR